VTTPPSSEYVEAINDSYRAIGRYVYEFSRLVWWLKFGITQTLQRTSTEAPWIGELLMGEAAAQQIANSFFGVMGSVDLDEEEKRVAKQLRNRVNQVIEKRNEIAHGDWWIGATAADQTLPEDPMLIRIRPVRKEGPLHHQNLGPAELDQLSDEIRDLRVRVGEFAALATGIWSQAAGLRVHDILVVKDGEVRRAGPKAGKLVPGDYA